MRRQLFAALVLGSLIGCKSGEAIGPQNESPSGAPLPSPELVSDAGEALEALLAAERRDGVIGWGEHRRRDHLRHAELAAVLRVMAIKGLVRALWVAASARAEGEVTAADLEASAELEVLEPGAADWRVVVSVISDEIAFGPQSPLAPLGGKALEALAGSAAALRAAMLQTSSALAGDGAAIESEHVQAAYRQLLDRLELDNPPRQVAPLTPLAIARSLIPLTRTLIENKARALAASGRASGDLATALGRLAERPVTEEAVAELRFQIRSLIDAAGAGAYVDHLEIRRAVQRQFPHRLLDDGGIAVRLEPDPSRPAAGLEPVDITVPAPLIAGVRETAAIWQVMAEAHQERPYAVDPIAAEILADAAAGLIAARLERLRESGAEAIDASMLRSAGLVPAPPRRTPVSAASGVDFVEVAIAGARAGAIAAGDVDGDGFSDLFAGGRLLLNSGKRRGLRFADASAAWGLPADLTGVERAALFDLEGDGDLDLLVLRRDHPVSLLVSDGGRFTDATAELGLATGAGARAAAIFDADRDGDLDIYLGHRGGEAIAGPLWVQGGGRLSEAAGVAGVASTALAFDADMDGDLDLYLAGEGGGVLQRNRGDGTFAVAEAIAAGDRGGGAAVGDVDGDGRWDLYLGGVDVLDPRLASSAGDDSTVDVDEVLLGARAVFAAARLPRVRDAVFFDADLDGDDDLYVAAGAEGSLWLAEAGQLVPAPSGPRGASDGVIAADFDLDGDVDLVVSRRGEAPVVLENRTRARGRWIRLALRDARAPGNPAGLGALVTIRAGATRVLRHVGAGQRAVCAGAGEARTVDVAVRWPDGTETAHLRLATNRAHALERR